MPDRTLKRLIDIGVSVALVPFAIVICLTVALPIWIECRASPLFWQVRLGKEERPFKLLKLRTMYPSARLSASHEIGEHMILRTGKIIRAAKIDELPQLWNVLRGEMSLVGPRPGLPIQVELTEARRHYNVFSLLPGISGISQIKGIDMSTPLALAESDATYLGQWSFRGDLAILCKTVVGKGCGDAAIGKQGRL